MNPANKKKQWGIIIGKPDPEHTEWKTRAPSIEEGTNIWYGQNATNSGGRSGNPDLFENRKEAEEKMQSLLKNQAWVRMYKLRVQKFNRHNPEP